MRHVLLVLMLLVATPAIADDVVTVQLPTEYDDGSPLPLAQISRWTVYWGTAADSYNVGAMNVQPTQLSVTVPRSGSGTVCYVVEVADSDGITSSLSDPVCRTVRRPKRPVIVSVK